jgi:hypothetical protein
MPKPDYTNSIVNLMSSIGRAFGRKSGYKELKQLPSGELKSSRNIVLLVLDGLGYNYLISKNAGLKKHLRGKITSVYPPTTASAITTFMTGVAPQQHASTGWFVHLKELGVVAKILPFSPRAGGKEFTNYDIKIEQILDAKGFSEGLKAKSYIIQHKRVLSSSYSKAYAKKAKMLGYSTFDGLLRQIKKVMGLHNKRKYVYAYWPMLDSIGHKYGIGSRKAERHFKDIDRKIMSFAKSLKGTGTSLIITADHGMVDCPENKMIDLEKHPKLVECLTLPLSGDSRTAYCYVHPAKCRQFEKYVKTKLGKCCRLYRNTELIRQNYYGLFEPNPKLIERTGDYVLVMNDNHKIRDNILDQKREFYFGNHGGDSADEIFVPLIVINT